MIGPRGADDVPGIDRMTNGAPGGCRHGWLRWDRLCGGRVRRFLEANAALRWHSPSRTQTPACPLASYCAAECG